jgi:hypothetical protein
LPQQLDRQPVGHFGCLLRPEKANTAAACDTCKPLKPAERCAACQAGAVPRWHPYQLRHNAAKRLVQQFGRGVARMDLGHR